MNRWLTWTGIRVVIAMAALWLLIPGAQGDSLDWDSRADRVSASIDGWSLVELLEQIASSTRWEVRYEPDLDHRVSVKFDGVKRTEALRRLLGSLNFALVEQRDGSGRLSVFRTSIDDATAAVETIGPTAAKAARSIIDDELVLTLKPDAEVTIEELARRWGATIVGRNDDLKMYRLKFHDKASTDAARDFLESSDQVDAVENNRSVPRPESPQILNAGPSLPAFQLKPTSIGREGQVIIGLIDTAVHPGNADTEGFLLPQLEVAGESAPPGELPSHGTSMFEQIMRAVAVAQEGMTESNVRVLPVDVYGQKGGTTTYEIAQGTHLAIQEGATVINYSLGGAGGSQFMESLIARYHEAGVMFVGAAGNTGGYEPTYPAAYTHVVAVTASDRNGDAAAYANQGEFVDVITPGSALISYQDQAFIITGTSPATATVSGSAAGIRDRFDLSSREAEAQIRDSLAFGNP